MRVIASLERFKCMGTLPDDFDSLRSNKQSDDNNIIHSTSSPLDQADLTSTEEANSAPSAQNMLPPEAQGEVNGGPLGCCLGTSVGLFLSITVAIFSRLYTDPLTALFQQNYGLMGTLIRILMGILAFVLAIFCGRLGWKLGKRFYREYEAPPVKERKRRPKPQHSKT